MPRGSDGHARKIDRIAPLDPKEEIIVVAFITNGGNQTAGAPAIQTQRRSQKRRTWRRRNSSANLRFA